MGTSQPPLSARHRSQCIPRLCCQLLLAAAVQDLRPGEQQGVHYINAYSRRARHVQHRLHGPGRCKGQGEGRDAQGGPPPPAAPL